MVRSELGSAVVPDVGFWRTAVDRAGEAVVAVDRGGVVCGVNELASRLLPDLAVGLVVSGSAAVCAAIRARVPAFEVDHGGSRLSGRRVGLAGLDVWFVRDVTELTRLTFLVESGRRLGASLGRDRAARTAVRLAVPVLGDVVIVLLPGTDSRWDWFRYAGADAESVAGVVSIGELEGFPELLEAMAGAELEEDPRLGAELEALAWAIPAGFGAVGSVLAVPLTGYGRPAGVLLAARQAGRVGFEPAEARLVRRYAALVGPAVVGATLYAEQVQTAEILRTSMRPPTLPAVRGAALGTAYRPARQCLPRLPNGGGDFYDVIRTGDGAGMFVLGHVCGAGVEVAVRAGEIRQLLTGLRLAESDPGRLLSLLNGALLELPESRLSTLVLGTFASVPAGRLKVRLGVAGHLPPLVLRAGGEVTALPAGGAILGAYPAARFDAVEVDLEPGDTLVVHGGGVVRARGGPTGTDAFGRERLIAELALYGGVPARVLAERIEMVVSSWLAEADHDIAVLAVQAPTPRGDRS